MPSNMRRQRDALFSVFVGHIHKSVSRSDLYQLFSGCGNIIDHCVLQDGPSQYNYGFVRYGKLEEARQALKELNGWPLKGVRIIVDVAKDCASRMQKEMASRPAPGRVLLPMDGTGNNRRTLSCIDKIENLSRIKECCAFMNIEIVGKKNFASRSIALVDDIEASGGSQLTHVLDPRLSRRSKALGKGSMRQEITQWEIDAGIPNSQLTNQFDKKYKEFCLSISGLLSSSRSPTLDEGRSSPTINFRSGNTRRRASCSSGGEDNPSSPPESSSETKPDQEGVIAPMAANTGDFRNIRNRGRLSTSEEEEVDVVPGFMRVDRPARPVKPSDRHSSKGLTDLLDLGKSIRDVERVKAKKIHQRRDNKMSSDGKSRANDIRFCGDLPEPGKLIHEDENDENEERESKEINDKIQFKRIESEEDEDEEASWNLPKLGNRQEQKRLAEELFSQQIESESENSTRNQYESPEKMTDLIDDTFHEELNPKKMGRQHSEETDSSSDSLDEINTKTSRGQPNRNFSNSSRHNRSPMLPDQSTILHFSRGEKSAKNVTSFSNFTSETTNQIPEKSSEESSSSPTKSDRNSSEESSSSPTKSVRLSKLAELLRSRKREASGVAPLK